jgi:hypothetical protein
MSFAPFCHVVLAGLAAAFLPALTPRPAAAQIRYDAECRPLPQPGFIMAPQPPARECLEERARQARAAEADRRRRQQQAEAAAAARQQMLAQQEAECLSATADDVKETVAQDPTILGRDTAVLDLTAPHFEREACRSELMTTRGIFDATIRSQEFNGKRFLRIQAKLRPGS